VEQWNLPFRQYRRGKREGPSVRKGRRDQNADQKTESQEVRLSINLDFCVHSEDVREKMVSESWEGNLIVGLSLHCAIEKGKNFREEEGVGVVIHNPIIGNVTSFAGKTSSSIGGEENTQKTEV